MIEDTLHGARLLDEEPLQLGSGRPPEHATGARRWTAAPSAGRKSISPRRCGFSPGRKPASGRSAIDAVPLEPRQHDFQQRAAEDLLLLVLRQDPEPQQLIGLARGPGEKVL